jgi:hypothetical protein
MKKLIVLMLVAAAFAVPVSAHAETVTQIVDFNSFVTACNGDTIALSGQLLIVQTTTATPSGGFVVSVHFQPQGINGTDLQTGTAYRGTGVTRDIVVTTPAGGTTETFVNLFRVQATAGADSFIVSQLVHFTVSATGVLTASVDKSSTSC